MKKLFENGIGSIKDAASSTYSRTISLFDDTASLISTSLGFIDLKALFIDKQMNEEIECDEKHYFLVPSPHLDSGYTMFNLRWLPEGVPPVNDLPKRRVFHFPHDNCEMQLKELMVQDARNKAVASCNAKSSLGEGLIGLANDIDRMESRVTNGALLLGGLVALVNPIIGVGIAAQSIIPSVGASLSQYGLRNVGDKLNQASVNKHIKNAEDEVYKQFQGSETFRYINPVLTMTAKCFSDEIFDAIEWINIQERLHSDDARDSRYMEAGAMAVCSTFKADYERSKKRSWFGDNKSVIPENLALWMSSIN